MHTTSPSLLEKLFLDERDSAWVRFVDLYTPLLFKWAHAWSLDDHQTNDVVQQVFLVCLKELPRFQRRRTGSFRHWLHTVLDHQCRAILRKSEPAGTLDEELRDESSDNSADGQMETEYCSYLAHRALQLMKSDFEEQTWQAFWKHRVEELPAAEVARQLNTTAGAVRVASSRVLARLRTELQGLLD